jgi:hypothetical protein
MVKKVRKPEVVRANVTGTTADGKGIYLEIFAKDLLLEVRFDIVEDEPEE